MLDPEGWPCALEACPPGPFSWLEGPAEGLLGYMSEYSDAHGPMAYNSAGERIPMHEHRKAKVQPLEPVWEEFEE